MGTVYLIDIHIGVDFLKTYYGGFFDLRNYQIAKLAKMKY